MAMTISFLLVIIIKQNISSFPDVSSNFYHGFKLIDQRMFYTSDHTSVTISILQRLLSSSTCVAAASPTGTTITLSGTATHSNPPRARSSTLTSSRTTWSRASRFASAKLRWHKQGHKQKNVLFKIVDAFVNSSYWGWVIRKWRRS